MRLDDRILNYFLFLDLPRSDIGLNVYRFRDHSASTRKRKHRFFEPAANKEVSNSDLVAFHHLTKECAPALRLFS